MPDDSQVRIRAVSLQAIDSRFIEANPEWPQSRLALVEPPRCLDNRFLLGVFSEDDIVERRSVRLEAAAFWGMSRSLLIIKK